MTDPGTAWLSGLPRPPRGRRLELEVGSGPRPGARRIPATCFVRTLGEEHTGPPVVLLHGWLASAGLNWIRAYAALGREYRVLAPDLQGHGRGPRPARPFSIEACADDVAAILDRLASGERAILVGYSMGGMVAQQVWRRHPSLVAGLVLAATSTAPIPTSRERQRAAGALRRCHLGVRLLHSLSAGPRRVRRGIVSGLQRILPPDPTPLWALNEFARHHWPTVVEAGHAVTRFDARRWIGRLDLPSAVVLTEQDRLVPQTQQQSMVRRLGPVHVERVPGGHIACLRDDFAERILRSCRAVHAAI